ncbi:MAG: DoxX family protein [Prevotella sp.]|nr:DoxX family protein [Prevotella sp.]
MNKLASILVNVCRLVLAVTLILSGFVKAIDPLGTQYKIQDYLTALSLQGILPDWCTLCLSVLLCAVEFCLGVFLLFAIHRRTVSKFTVFFMVVMTLITLWLWWANPVSDCGCFGDALVLTNGETLVKNVVLLALAIVVSCQPLRMVRFISKSNQWIVINYTLLFILACSAWCLYDLPIFDFRPYHEGADLRKGMEIPEGEQPPQFETTFILEKDGERKEFTLEEYPDSTWKFIDSKTVQTAKGYVPPIHDFSIETLEGDDITDSVLSTPGYTFLLVSHHLEQASDSDFGEIDQLYEYSRANGYPFYCLTASGEKGMERWRELTGAEYPFCITDGTTLKTIIRSNPGLLLLKQGTVVRKWSHNRLPEISELNGRLEKLPIGRTPEDSTARKVATILMWFVLPLGLLTLADRLWASVKWLWRRNKQQQ